MGHSGLKRRHFIGSCLAAVPAAPLRGQTGAGANQGKLFAGAAMANITPGLGCAIAGNMTYTPASEIHDELHVRSLVLDNGRTRLAFAVVDSCMVPGDVIQRAKQLVQQHTDIPPVNFLVSATHTHSAPPATHLFQSLPDPAFVEWLITRIADSVRMAVNRLRPARVGWGNGREESLLFTRRYFLKPGTMPPNPFDRTDDLVKMNPGAGNPNILRPESAIDPDLGVLAVESVEGQPICVLSNYEEELELGVRLPKCRRCCICAKDPRGVALDRATPGTPADLRQRNRDTERELSEDRKNARFKLCESGNWESPRSPAKPSPSSVWR